MLQAAIIHLLLFSDVLAHSLLIASLHPPPLTYEAHREAPTGQLDCLHYWGLRFPGNWLLQATASARTGTCQCW